jgi:flagellar L-ring protein precursor FlgH
MVGRTRRRTWTIGAAAAMLLAWPVTAGAQGKQAAKPAGASYEELFNKYLADARKMTASPAVWLADLMRDPRAHRVNDLLTIQVVESMTASGTADSTLNKSGSSAVTASGSLGTTLSKLLPVASETKFTGAGQTDRAGSMTATITARVSEVLPNGDLVVEGVRELEINGDKQLAVLNGVVRVADITTSNVISSLSVGQLQIRYLGKGLIKDSLSPGWLIKFLNKIF